MIFKLELSPQNFHYNVLYPLYSGDPSKTFHHGETYGHPNFTDYILTSLPVWINIYGNQSKEGSQTVSWGL